MGSDAHAYAHVAAHFASFTSMWVALLCCALIRAWALGSEAVGSVPGERVC